MSVPKLPTRSGPAGGRFVDKSVVVTGGSRGIGLAIAKALLAEGAKVLITGRDPRVMQLSDDLASTYDATVVGCVADVASPEAARALADLVDERFGHLDALVNNAAIACRAPFPEVSLQEWNEVIGVNLTGVFLVTQVLLSPLRRRPGSSVVNIASQAGKRGEALIAPYATSKAGLIGLTKSLALELAPELRVNAVCPGVIETDMILEHYQEQARLTGRSPEQVRQEIIANIPLRRPQAPESVASVVAFLASEEARDITGQAFNVDGGMVMD